MALPTGSGSGLHEERLSKTSAEQSIWRNIQELERELGVEQDSVRRNELAEQISELKNQLASLQGPNYTELEGENQRMKKELAITKAKLLSAIKECNSLKGCATISIGNEGEQDASRERQFKLYRMLLSRYSGLINEYERKTVGELKALINEKDLTVQSIIQGQVPQGYVFARDYGGVAKKIFGFVHGEMNYVDSDMELNFWLSPKEIVNNRMGDDEDLAVFLCTLLFAAGDENAEVVIAELDDMKTHAFVITEYAGNFYILDPSQGHAFGEFSGERKAVLQKYGFRGLKIRRFLYRFNATKYEQFI